METKMIVQKVMIGTIPMKDETVPMYYKYSDKVIRKENGVHVVDKNASANFFTYFNSFSIEKWKKYTYLSNLYLEIDAEGTFSVDLFGHYINSLNTLVKEWLGLFKFKHETRQKVIIPFPEVMNSTVVGFQITAIEKTAIHGINYVTNIEEKYVKEPFITMATTTFRKEEYIRKNWEILNATLFSNPEYKKNFNWKIVDNGRTLDVSAFCTDAIEVLQNPNAGGSGGFARGMIEALRQTKKPTHVLLMDDDVEIIPESFIRLCTLLKLIRPEYENHFISGAMLEIHERNVQHEDVGVFSTDGKHGPSKARFDLSRKGSVVKNEILLPEDVHQYSGWWYCCIPTTVVREDNLPLPLFVRGDDVEYSIRNNAKFISMNGICIWHEGFGTKFSGVMELYQVHRNDLIILATLDSVADIALMKRITDLFWQEVYKFNYKGAGLLLDAVEDYLKGPEYIKTLDGEQCMKEHKAKDNAPAKITPDIAALMQTEDLFEYVTMGKVEKFIYDYSCNGHRLPWLFGGSRVATIPYGWDYNPGRNNRAKTILAIDVINWLYVKYERSPRKYRELKRRFNEVMSKYNATNESVRKAYRDSFREVTGIDFWQKYLKM